ncbi:hypothetical protein [Ammoniphilus sp. 3BR4]|uniref:Nmad3 family putative nucleotide modification protein n=1 Tax=Ammoniphilus sp. 3BR4 TaxID=3158265 RepID=UPI0034668DAC
MGYLLQDLLFDNKYSYLQVMKDLGITQCSEAHLDPDLIRSVFPDRHPDWQPAFGQSKIAQATLAKKKVKKGDLFLFFGWYKTVEVVKGKFNYKEGKGRNKGVHAIYGYLEVDEVIDLRNLKSKIPEGLKKHLHVYKRKDYPVHNSLYVATKRLSFDDTKPGAGCFLFSEHLVLTENGRTKSNWLLPLFLRSYKATLMQRSFMVRKRKIV